MTHVVVAGAGIVGRLTALRLVEAGVDVVLVDAGHPSATAAAGAMLGVHSEVASTDDEPRRAIDLAERALARALWDGLADELDVELTPGLFVIANARGHDDARELSAIAAAAGPELAKPVAPRDVPGLQPRRDARPFEALWLPGDATVDAAAALDALDRILGDVVLHRSSVEEIALTDDRVTTRLADGTAVSSDRIVLALGVGTSPLLAASGLSDLGVPTVLGGRGVSLVVQDGPVLPHAVRTPNRAFACGLHALPRTARANAPASTYIGATNRLSTRPDPDVRPALGELATLLTGAETEIARGFRDATLMGTAVGHRPFVADHLPLVGATRDPRVVVATGTYRNGWLLAPRVATLVTAEITTPGSSAAHAFSALRSVSPAPALITDLIGAGAADALVEEGVDAVEQFVVTVLRALVGSGERDRLVRKLERLLATAPVDELGPLLVEAVVRHR